MNKHQQATADRMRSIALQVRDDLQLHDWTVRFVYSTEPEGSENTSSDAGLDASATTVITKVLWQYRQTTFHVFLPMAATATDERLYFIWVHEWVHVMHGAMTPYLKSGTAAELADEWTTETICRALMAALGKPIPED